MLKTPSVMESREVSKNAASSRAIPVSKMIEDILADPAVPVFWGKNVRGMQAREELTGLELQAAKDNWFMAMEAAIKYATAMTNLLGDDENPIGTHKQIVNRILEPFSHITTLMSATEWDNFLELRLHGDAEPHINLLAQEISRELDKPAMQTLQPGDWHTPFAHTDEDLIGAVEPGYQIVKEGKIKLSVSRCASTSYKTVEGFDMTLERATAIYDKLVTSKPVHASPCEHVAQADDTIALLRNEALWMNPSQHRNFVGFRQHRAMIGA